MRSGKKLKAKDSKSVELEPIPDEPEIEEVKIEDTVVVLYGPPKIGKSTLCSQLDDPVFLRTEPGTKFLKVRKADIKSWESFRKRVEWLEEHLGKDFNCGPFIVDTTDNLAKFCLSYICDKKNIEHPADLSYGKGWEALNNEWHEWIVRLCMLNHGVFFICHSQERDVKLRVLEITKTMPAIGQSFYKTLNAIADFIFYAGFKIVKDKKTGKKKEIRVMYTKATESMEAGDRTGRLPETIKFDIQSFRKAFYGHD